MLRNALLSKSRKKLKKKKKKKERKSDTMVSESAPMALREELSFFWTEIVYYR